MKLYVLHSQTTESLTFVLHVMKKKRSLGLKVLSNRDNSYLHVNTVECKSYSKNVVCEADSVVFTLYT